MTYEKKNRKFIAKPVFEGGEQALRRFVSKHVKYPPAHLDERISGTVEIKIDINASGKVSNSKVLKSLSKAFDEEAARVVALLRFTIPGSGARSGKVVFHRTLKISFKPPPVKAKVTSTPTPSSMQYTITSTSKKAAPTPKASQPSYGYTITIG